MASGDKFYLADKETLDEVDEKLGSTKDTGGSSTSGSVFGKINYLVSQVSSYLATIYSWSNTLMGKIGNTNDSEGTATTGTVMGKLNYLVTRMGSVCSCANNIFSRVGATTDTGGTATEGTVMAKENAILAEVNKIGAANDTGGSETAGTLMGKSNEILKLLCNAKNEKYRLPKRNTKTLNCPPTVSSGTQNYGEIIFEYNEPIVFKLLQISGSPYDYICTLHITFENDTDSYSCVIANERSDISNSDTNLISAAYGATTISSNNLSSFNPARHIPLYGSIVAKRIKIKGYNKSQTSSTNVNITLFY